MMSASFFGSGGYCPSGKCDWFKLLTVALPLNLLGALVLSFLVAKVFVWGHYYYVLIPALAGLLLGVEAVFLLRFAHCRNPYVAAGFGLLLGSVMFLGYFHCHCVLRLGPRALTRIDYLSKFIIRRMNTDVMHSSHEMPNQNQKKQPVPVLNWIFFTLDWVTVAGVCAAMTFQGARRAYCEACSRWMLTKKALTAPGWAGKVAAAVVAKQIASLPVLPRVEKKRGALISQFELEYCPGNQDQADVCPIFLTAREVSPGNKKNVTVARQVPLSVEELAELSKKLTFL